MEKDNALAFQVITEKMLETYKKKNHDYGNSFDQSLDKHGLVAAIVRIGDKMNRIETLCKNTAQVSDESIADTLLDMANYCIMTKMWLDSKRGAVVLKQLNSDCEPTKKLSDSKTED